MIRPVQKDLYAVIGNPVAHSLSPVMMNAVFEALRLPAVYLALQVDNLEDDLATLAKLGIQGLSVTIPHKESAYRLADLTDEPAQAMGAVNTLRLHGSRWEGRNTDWIGALSALRHAMDRSAPHSHPDPPQSANENAAGQANAPSHPPPISSHPSPITHDPSPITLHSSLFTLLPFENQRALLIGAGGVARAVGYGLKREGAALTITNRGVARGEALARTLACAFVPLSELGRHDDGMAFDIMVQCTSVGLMEEREFTLIPDSLFRPGAVVMDTVYRPLWTPFLRKAKAAGCLAVPGVEMLLHQGVAQLVWWFGGLIHPEVVLPVMRTILLGILADEEDNQKASRGI